MQEQKRTCADADYCAAVKMLDTLVESGVCSKKEARNIAARLAVRYGASIILYA